MKRILLPDWKSIQKGAALGGGAYLGGAYLMSGEGMSGAAHFVDEDAERRFQDAAASATTSQDRIHE